MYQNLDTDFDFAGCQGRIKSASGYIYLLAVSDVSQKNVEQDFIASSTMAAKFITCYEASNHGIW